MRHRLVVIAIVLLVPLVSGGLIGYSIGHSGSRPGAPVVPTSYEDAPFEEAKPESYQAAKRDSISEAVGTSRRNAITRTVAQSGPAIVGINVIELREYRYTSPFGDDPFFRQFFPDRTYTQRVQGLGSGFLISPDGYILTNDHVAGNAKEITVTLTNGEKHKAEIVGTDHTSDICLLKIKGQNFPYLRLGNSDGVIIGEWVIAFGNPFGLFDISDQPTVTVGVVSATKMKMQAEDRVYRDLIQTDAAINPGNSGGPLVNTLGEVIGVNSAIYTPNQGSIGLGFAIPVNRVKGILAELKRSGKVDRSYWTGLDVQTVDRRIARYFGLARAEGVIVSDVKSGSPAEQAGLKAGDIIMSANGEPTPDEASLVAIFDDARVGDVVHLKVFRDRKTIDVSLKLEKKAA